MRAQGAIDAWLDEGRRGEAGRSGFGAAGSVIGRIDGRGATMFINPSDLVAYQYRAQLRTAAASGTADPQAAVLASITASYFFLRRGLAAFGFLFPIVLWLGADPHHLQTSVSAYYHYSASGHGGPGAGTMRNVFVGVLWAVGAFLFFYKGYSYREDWTLNLAGIAAAGIACFPMDWTTLEAGATLTGKIHFASAFAFFVAIAVVCLTCADETLAALADEAKRRRFKQIYTVLGVAMVAVPLAVFAAYWLEHRPKDSFVVLAIEVAGIWIFAAFWLVKSREIALIERQ
jgi:hypothetical protein